MRLKTLTFLLVIFFFNFSFSQTNSFKTVEEHYSDYFSLNHETIYTQLNKTKYLSSEELWFKSYIYNTKTQKPYLTTTNVYVSIYNDVGELIDKKLFYAEDGMTYGNLDLSEYYPGFYYIKVSTNYMRNFNVPHFSLQVFEIVGNGNGQYLTHVVDKKYDFQLLPESGHLLSNTINTIGFKILDQEGNGIKIESGKVYDSKKNVVTTFNSNNLGMGKLSLFVDSAEDYIVEIQLNDGSTIKEPLPKPEQLGVIMNINNLNPETLFVSLTTNVSTLPSISNKTYYLVIHRDGLLKKIDVNFNANKLRYIIPIPKEELLKGMNILTVFNDQNKPILERLVYNYSASLHNTIDIQTIEKGLDSTTIKLKTNLKDTIQKNISISVLPESTKSYATHENILTRFLLKPYIKGEVENPSYYFKNYDRKKAIDLDLLLLTQGWSSYSWNSILFTTMKAVHHFEAGMQIKGKVNNSNNYNKKEDIILYSKESELMLTTELDKDNYFSFDNVFLIDSTSLFFSQRDKKGNISKPVVYINIYPNLVPDKLESKYLKNLDYKYDQTIFNESFSVDNTTVLDTVFLEKTLENKPQNIINRGALNSQKINIKERYAPFAVVTDVIRDNGFDVVNTGLAVQILSRRTTGFAGRAEPNIFVDNRPLSDLEIINLTYLTLDQVDEIYISQTPAAGLGKFGGNINIFTTKGFGSDVQKLSFSENTVGFGFTLPDQYYAPYYNDSHHLTYSEYAVLNWLPNLNMSESGIFEFKVPNYTYEGITLFIEGMAEDGSLISKIETIELK